MIGEHLKHAREALTGKKEQSPAPPPLPPSCHGRRGSHQGEECKISLIHYHCYHCDETIIPGEGVSHATAGTLYFEIRVRWGTKEQYDPHGIAICTACVVSALVKGR